LMVCQSVPMLAHRLERVGSSDNRDSNTRSMDLL
jgi:hypothetical protein